MRRGIGSKTGDESGATKLPVNRLDRKDELRDRLKRESNATDIPLPSANRDIALPEGLAAGAAVGAAGGLAAGAIKATREPTSTATPPWAARAMQCR